MSHHEVAREPRKSSLNRAQRALLLRITRYRSVALGRCSWNLWGFPLHADPGTPEAVCTLLGRGMTVSSLVRRGLIEVIDQYVSVTAEGFETLSQMRSLMPEQREEFAAHAKALAEAHRSWAVSL